MRDFLSTPFLGNTAQDWMIALAVALVVMALVRVAIRLILRRLKSVAAKTDTDVDDLIAELDAVVAHLYGLDAEDLEVIWDTFHTTVDHLPSLDMVLGYQETWAR